MRSGLLASPLEPPPLTSQSSAIEHSIAHQLYPGSGHLAAANFKGDYISVRFKFYYNPETTELKNGHGSRPADLSFCTLSILFTKTERESFLAAPAECVTKIG